MPGVGVPVAAEGLPGLLVHGRHVRRGPGVEDEQSWTVFADHVLRESFVGGIGGDGCEALAEFVAYGEQPLLVAGDADDAGARGDERGGDRAPEAAAGTGDNGGLEEIGHRTLRSGGRVRSASRPAAGGESVASAESEGVMSVIGARPLPVRPGPARSRGPRGANPRLGADQGRTSRRLSTPVP